MSTIAVKKVKLGDNADLSKNFLIEVPAVADGTLTIKREDGTSVLSIDATGKAVIPGVVGTVAQVGGIPTGQIVERGSNANGDYVRFADGTQICMVTQTHAGLAVSTSFGGGFVSEGRSWTFPANFDNQPFATFFGRGPIRLSWPITDQPATSVNATYYLAAIVNQAAADTVVRGIAVGRWF